MFIGLGYAGSTYGQDILEKKISIELQNASLRKALDKIEKLSDARFMYHSQLIAEGDRVSVEAENKPLADVLNTLLGPFHITYEVSGKQIVLMRDRHTNAVPGDHSEGLVEEETPDHTIAGTVIDENGVPLPGVNIVQKGTTVGTSTDAEGKYKVTVESGEGTLVFSFIGYITEEVPINSRTVIDMTLFPDISTLSEVVVIGYGAVKKRDLTGSVYSVKSEDIVKTPTHNAVEAMQGRVPGMDIVRSSGAPGAGTNVVIRGNKSITSRDKMVERNSPLYVVDGYQLPQGSSIDNLNVNDIESIEVLKDASATSIYGAMGANGVVIVTTKKGTEGKARVSYNGYYGINTYSFPKARVGDDYVQLRREAFRTAGDWSSPADDQSIFTGAGEWEAIQAGQWVDWVDLVKEDGLQQSHTISITGGSENTKVFTSAGYFKEEGMLRNNDFTRYNVRLNLDQTLSKWAKTGILSQVTYSKQNDRINPLGQALRVSPLGVPYNENGVVNSYPIVGNPDVLSPLADEKNAYIARNNTIRTNILANGYLELTPLPGLSLRSNFGANISFGRQGIYYDAQSLAQNSTKISVASSESAFDRFLNWDNILTYTWQKEDHTVTVTGITSYLQSDVDNTEAEGTNQIVASQLYYGLDGTTPSSLGSPYVGWKNMAYAGRLNYSFRGKYLLSVSGRYDGASRLAPGNKWAFFPSVALSWNINDERFLQDVTFLNNLKLRGSYGVSGNYAIDVYGTQSGLFAGRNMTFGDNAAPIYQFNTLIGNPNLGWETSATTNVGLDVAVVENKISASVDVYRTITSDILMERSLPQSSGVEKVYQNIAETRNQGIELAITTQNMKRGGFEWSTTLTFSSNKEEITNLIDGRDIIATNSERESLLLGHPINSFYTFKKEGIWQSDDADEASQYHKNGATGQPFVPGDIRLADLNGDFIISADSDRMYIGSTVPKWVAGLQNTFRYKGLDLSIFMFMRYGQTIDAQFLGRYNPSGEGNGPAIIDYWTPENPTNDFPRPRKGEPLYNYIGYQALNFVDGSFFKIRNITLGYTLPDALTERISIQRVRFYVTGNNVFIKAKSDLIENYDPERGGAESSPLSRSVVFGINVDF